MSKDENRGRTNEHVHSYNGLTTCDKGHSHMVNESSKSCGFI
jgi:hypothetical protein